MNTRDTVTVARHCIGGRIASEKPQWRGSGTFERENAELRALERRHELTTEPPEMSSGGSNRSDWFWQRMKPHFDHRSDGVGLIVDGRLAQAFARDCAPDELAVWSWVGLGEETAVDSWTRTQTGLCVNSRVLPHNALPSVSVATMSVSDWVSGAAGGWPADHPLRLGCVSR